MFVLDAPSSINYQAPTWYGGFTDWVGKSEQAIAESSKAVFSAFKTVVDPASQSRVLLEQAGSNAIAGGAQAVFGAIGDATSSIAKGLGNVVSPLTSGIKWAVILIILGLTAYLFMPLIVAKVARG